jgi:nucleoside-diphosphate-sugar epimerase
VTKAFLHAMGNFESMKGEPYNVGLEDTNISKVELCQEIQKIVPHFAYLEAPIGKDVDKRDYIVSNQKILATGFTPDWNLPRGIEELVKAYTILRTPFYANI